MIFKLKGVVQHYAWGGFDLIPSLLGEINEEQKPWAEYWLGVHPKGPALAEYGEQPEDLPSLLKKHPELLGEEVNKQFGELPFLLKILDVRQMLSIQLHPTKEKAKLGFAVEEKKEIAPLAANRNYKDQNHKPEVMVALSDFWLLHGFKSISSITEVLESIPLWAGFLPILQQGGIKALYGRVMSMPQKEVDQRLEPLFQILDKKQKTLTKNEPAYWAWQAFQQYTKNGHYDRGIFSIYFLNLVYLREGEGIFQGAGIPHAYLEGVNVELMANSDNVLRGGLTPKHVDVPELLDNVKAEEVIPNILKTQADENGITNYFAPIDDFSLDKIELANGKELEIKQKGPAVFLIMKGNLLVNGKAYHTGEAFFASDSTEVVLTTEEVTPAVIFRAYV